MKLEELNEKKSDRITRILINSIEEYRETRSITSGYAIIRYLARGFIKPAPHHYDSATGIVNPYKVLRTVVVEDIDTNKIFQHYEKESVYVGQIGV